MSDYAVVFARDLNDVVVCAELWRCYRDSFVGQEQRCAQNQMCYDETTFLAALHDPEYLKFYATIGGHIVAFTLGTTNLEKARVAYVNPEHYVAAFPAFAPDRIYYFTSLDVLPEHRNKGAFARVVAAAIKFAREHNGICAFDFSHETVASLPQMFTRLTEGMCKRGDLVEPLEYVRVGTQEFGALVPVAGTTIVQKPFGRHLMLAIYGCGKAVLEDLNLCYRFLDELPAFIGMEKQSTPFVVMTDGKRFPDKAGLSAGVAIVESAIWLHTLSATGAAFIDVFSCKDFDPARVETKVREYFNPREIVREGLVVRGVDYYVRIVSTQ